MKAITLRQKLETIPDNTDILISENDFEERIDRPLTDMTYLAQATDSHGYVYNQNQLTKPCLIEKEIQGNSIRDIQVKAEDAFNPTWALNIKPHRKYNGIFKPHPSWEQIAKDGMVLYRFPISNSSYLQLTPII